MQTRTDHFSQIVIARQSRLQEVHWTALLFRVYDRKGSQPDTSHAPPKSVEVSRRRKGAQ